MVYDPLYYSSAPMKRLEYDVMWYKVDPLYYSSAPMKRLEYDVMWYNVYIYPQKRLQSLIARVHNYITV